MASLSPVSMATTSWQMSDHLLALQPGEAGSECNTGSSRPLSLRPGWAGAPARSLRQPPGCWPTFPGELVASAVTSQPLQCLGTARGKKAGNPPNTMPLHCHLPHSQPRLWGRVHVHLGQVPGGLPDLQDKLPFPSTLSGPQQLETQPAYPKEGSEEGSRWEV